MAFIHTGLAGLDHAHADLDFCLRDLRRAVQERDAVLARGWACLMVQKLGQHFSDEEKLMRTYGWSHLAAHAESHGRILDRFIRFERRFTVVRRMTLDLSYLALIHLPEVLRVHEIKSDFGFAKFAMSVRAPRLPTPVLRPVEPGRPSDQKVAPAQAQLH